MAVPGQSKLIVSPASSWPISSAEHRPTFTTGRRDSLPASLARIELEKDRLAHAGADWAVTRRGGQVTYHGPGQLVGYLFFDLQPLKVSDSSRSWASTYMMSR